MPLERFWASISAFMVGKVIADRSLNSHHRTFACQQILLIALPFRFLWDWSCLGCAASLGLGIQFGPLGSCACFGHVFGWFLFVHRMVSPSVFRRQPVRDGSRGR